MNTILICFILNTVNGRISSFQYCGLIFFIFSHLEVQKKIKILSLRKTTFLNYSSKNHFVILVWQIKNDTGKYVCFVESSQRTFFDNLDKKNSARKTHIFWQFQVCGYFLELLRYSWSIFKQHRIKSWHAIFKFSKSRSWS